MIQADFYFLDNVLTLAQLLVSTANLLITLAKLAILPASAVKGQLQRTASLVPVQVSFITQIVQGHVHHSITVIKQLVFARSAP